MAKLFWEAVKARRSIYSIGSEKTVPETKIEEIVREALLHTPSPFNSQSTRLVLLFGKEHKKLWDLTLAELEKIVSPKQFEQTAKKINDCFASGYGTILFFEEKKIVENLCNSFPSYADRFPFWSHHTNAMHQFVIWTALESEGLGASLQHYNPLIDDAVRSEWGLPESWQLIAQMPFGKVLAPAGDKEFGDIDERLKIFR
ncbi:MAG: nitroreductase family protein [Negativicutes bacterium]|nr:nitroreductase family protein [Negativicutes bacterium]